MDESQDGQDAEDDLEALFDEDNEEDEYKEGGEEEGRHDAKAEEMSELFGDVDEEEGDHAGAAAEVSSSQDLQGGDAFTHKVLQNSVSKIFPTVQFDSLCPQRNCGACRRRCGSCSSSWRPVRKCHPRLWWPGLKRNGLSSNQKLLK